MRVEYGLRFIVTAKGNHGRPADRRLSVGGGAAAVRKAAMLPTPATPKAR